MAKEPKRKIRKDGRFQDYVFLGYNSDGSENRKWAYAYSEKELEKKLFEIKLTIAKGEYISNNNMTVKQWGELWLKNYKKGKEYKTYKMYETALNNHIIKDLGHMRLVDLKPFHIQGLINDRREQGLTKTLTNIKLTAKQMFEQAIENDFMIKNPARKLDMPSINKSQKRALEDEEIEIIKKTRLSIKQKAFVYICLYAGLRREEVLALTKKDIDFINNIIKVNKVINFRKNQGVPKPYTKTEAGIRDIPILNILKPVLQTHLEEVKGIYLFHPVTKGGLMTETAFRSMWATIWRALNKTAGGNYKIKAINKDITPHILRHTYATMLYYAGVDIKQTQYLLGHASAEVTLEIYTHLDKKKGAPTEKLNAYLSVVNT
jgi:integrase